VEGGAEEQEESSDDDEEESEDAVVLCRTCFDKSSNPPQVGCLLPLCVLLLTFLTLAQFFTPGLG
jgi:hypothetical protein